MRKNGRSSLNEPLTRERRGGRNGGGFPMPVRRVSPSRQPWNEGLLVGQKKPLEPKHVWSIRVRLEIAGSKRDLVIFNLAQQAARLRSGQVTAGRHLLWVKSA